MSKQSNDFSKWVIRQTFDGCDIDATATRDKAVELGLLKKELFNPRNHGTGTVDVLKEDVNIYLFTYLINKGG